jgi:hypothetical protein
MDPSVLDILLQMEQVERYKQQELENQKAHRNNPGPVQVAPLPYCLAVTLEAILEGLPEELFKYGFKLVSHLMTAIGDPAYQERGIWISQGVRMRMAKLKRTDTLAAWTKTLVERGIIDLMPSGFNKDGLKNQAHRFRLSQSLMLKAREHGNKLHVYSTPRTFRNREAVKVKPSKTYHDSFGKHPQGKQALKPIIMDLQARPVRCDLGALKAYMRTLPDDQQGKWLFIEHSLTDGPNYAQYKMAESGRIQSFDRNLQGIPKKLRRFFYPESDEFVFLDLDYRSQESWILAVFSDDDNLMDILLTGDIYQSVVDHFPQEALTRPHAKAMVNAYHYGAGVETIAKAAYDLDGPPSAQQLRLAREFVQYMLKTYPKAAAWMTTEKNRIRKVGAALAPDGVKRTGIPQTEARTVGVNHVIQGTGAVMLWRILGQMDAKLSNIGKVIVPLHDGLLLQIRRDKIDEARRVTVQVMEDAFAQTLYGLRPPQLVETQIGWRHKDEDPAACNLYPRQG